MSRVHHVDKSDDGDDAKTGPDNSPHDGIATADDAGRSSSQRRPSEVTLTQLRYFVRAAELHSMSRAAESLYVAQSAVSTSIANLERHLDRALFVRHRSKGLSLTADGETYLGHVRRILERIDDAALAIDPTRIGGTYEIGCFPTLVPFWMPSLVHEVQLTYPQLRTKIREVRQDEIETRLFERALEMILTYDFPMHNDIAFVPIADAPPYAIVSVEHPLANRQRVDLVEIADTTPFILLDMVGSAAYFQRVLAASGANVEVAFRLENYEAVRAMVARNHGFSLLNQRPRHDFTYDGFETRTLELESSLPSLRVGFATRSRESLTRKGQAVIAVSRQLALNGRRA